MTALLSQHRCQHPLAHLHAAVPCSCAYTPEQPAFAISSQVRLHALKAAHAIVEHLAGGVDAERAKGLYPGPLPACCVCVLAYEHVIGEQLSEGQVLQGKGVRMAGCCDRVVGVVALCCMLLLQVFAAVTAPGQSWCIPLVMMC